MTDRLDQCCRIHSRYDLPILPLVILGDTRQHWRPRAYSGGFAHHGHRTSGSPSVLKC
jgi:hypothetical protein